MSLLIFSRNLRYLRKQKRLTQDQVSKKIFIGRPAYASYEEARAFPPPEVLLRICEHFHETDIYKLLSVEIKSLG